MQITNKQITCIVEYGFIEVMTSKGLLRYSFQRGSGYDDNIQLESSLSVYSKLSDKEREELDLLIESSW